MDTKVSDEVKKMHDEMLTVYVGIYIQPIQNAKVKSLLADVEGKIYSSKSLDEGMKIAQDIKGKLSDEISTYLNIKDVSEFDDETLLNTFSSKIEASYSASMGEIIGNQNFYERMKAHSEMLKEFDGAKVLWGFLIEELHFGSAYRVYGDQIQLKATEFSKGIVNSGNISRYIPEYQNGDRVIAIQHDLPLVRGKMLIIGRPKLFPLKTPVDVRKKLTTREIERDDKIKKSELVEMVLVPGKYDLVIDFNDEQLVRAAEITAKFIICKYLISWIEERVTIKNGFNLDKALKGDSSPSSGNDPKTRADLLILDTLFSSIRHQNKTEDYHFLLGKMVNRKTSTVKKYLGVQPSKLKATDEEELKIQKASTELAIKKLTTALDILSRRNKE